MPDKSARSGRRPAGLPAAPRPLPALLALCSCLLLCPPADAAGFPVVGRDALREIRVVDDHSDLLAAWMSGGVRDATLINFDVHHDLSPVARAKMEKLKAFYAAGDTAAVREANSLSDEGLYNLGNFIHAATRLGIVREVFWIIPQRIPRRPEAAAWLGAFLAKNRIPDSDRATFHGAGGCFKGIAKGTPLGICSLESLPSITRPVILSIDADYLPSLAAEHGIKKLAAARKLLEGMGRKRYAAVDVSVSRSLNGGYTTPTDGWLVDVVAKGLEAPGALTEGRLPEVWSAYQEADRRVNGYLREEAVPYLEPLLRRHGDDPWLLLYAADAHYQRNEIDRAFAYAEKACTVHRPACFGLPYLGRYLVREGRAAEAERFFERGWSLSSRMIFSQWEMAFADRAAGRLKLAERTFERLRPLVGSFPVDLFIGELSLLLEGGATADRHCRRALEVLSALRGEERDFGEVGGEIVGAALLFQQRGRTWCAESLRSEPALRNLFVR